MPEVVGGLWITEYEFTRSFGIEPASASGKAVLGAGGVSIGIQVGDYLAYSFGGIVFYGVISNIVRMEELRSGREYTFQMVDNRVRLPWQWVFAEYNMVEDLSSVFGAALLGPPAGEFSAGGASGGDGVDFAAGGPGYAAIPAGTLGAGSMTRGRVYRHRVPSQWAGGFNSFTYAPASAADILRSAFKGAIGGFGFTLDLHPSQSDPVFDVDAGNGMSLASLVSMLCDAQGLQCTLDGSRTLRFERRGEGTLILPGPPVQIARDGEALSADPTKVRVVGDRRLVQVNNIPLVPDWARGWEAYISEPAWLDRVNAVFGPYDEGSAGRAELAAKAREVTLREYLVESDDEAAEFADFGRWGNINRMSMEVWTYLNSIVFCSYRIAADTELYGVPMRSLEIHDGLLAAVEIGETTIRYRTDPVEFYPQASSYVIAKGQPIDLVSVMDREALVRVRQKDMRATWSEMPDFSLDPANHSIRFSKPVFIDGDPEEDKSILLYPNKGQGGYQDVSDDVDDEDGEESDYLRVVLPNPDYEIEPALVKCSLTFRLGPFFRDFGTGARWTVHQTSLAEHLLDTTGDSFAHAMLDTYDGPIGMPSAGANLKEIVYDDGDTTIEKAEAQASGLILKNPLEREGEFVRRGSAGTLLSGVIDRVTIRINQRDGIVETSEFAKPRSAKGFTSGRELARRVRTESLYEGHAALKREVRMLKSISALERTGPQGDEKRSPSHRVITDLVRKPAAGGGITGVVTYHDVNSQWPEGRDTDGWRGGDLLWLDGEGVPSRSGETLGGVVVAKPPDGAKHVVCASVGSSVPVAVAPGVGPSEVLKASPGDWKAGSEGSYPIGMLAHGKPVPGTGEATIALVRQGQGGGGGGAVRLAPLQLITSRPGYYPEPATEVADGMKRVWVRLGSCMGRLADNWGSHFDCPIGVAEEGETAIPDTWFWAKIYLGAGTFVNVTHWEIVKGETVDAFINPPWPPGGTRPNVHYHPLGQLFAASGTVFNTGGGSLIVSENVVNIENSTRVGVAKLTRGIYVQREGY